MFITIPMYYERSLDVWGSWFIFNARHVYDARSQSMLPFYYRMLERNDLGLKRARGWSSHFKIQWLDVGMTLFFERDLLIRFRYALYVFFLSQRGHQFDAVFLNDGMCTKKFWHTIAINLLYLMQRDSMRRSFRCTRHYTTIKKQLRVPRYFDRTPEEDGTKPGADVCVFHVPAVSGFSRHLS